MAAFKRDDGVVVDSRHLHRSFLRETRSLPQRLHPSTAPLVCHCSQQYHNMSRGTTLPASRLGPLPVLHRAFLAPLRPWDQRLLAGTVSAQPLGNTSQLVGSLPGYGFVGHRIGAILHLCGGEGFEPSIGLSAPCFRTWDGLPWQLPTTITQTFPPHMLPIEGDNPTLRDSRIVVKKNPFILPGVFALKRFRRFRRNSPDGSSKSLTVNCHIQVSRVDRKHPTSSGRPRSASHYA